MSLPSKSVVPAHISSPQQAYTPPQLTPLGKWTAVTLITSIPMGPGSNMFNSDSSWNKF